MHTVGLHRTPIGDLFRSSLVIEQIERALFEPCWTSPLLPEMNRDTGGRIAYWTTCELNALADELSPREVAVRVLSELRTRVLAE